MTADALATSFMVMELEEELGIELELDEKISTVGEMVKLVEEKMGEKE